MSVSYLDKAVSALRNIGISFKPDDAPIVAILEKVAKYDQSRITSIAATLQQSASFNAVVRDQIQGMDISTRFADITTSFNSIRDDSQQMAVWMADGKLDFKEKIQYTWMRMRRGSIPDRFNSIRADYLGVAKSSADQITREGIILDAYRDYRMALKSSEVEAQDVLKVADEAVATRRAALASAGAAVEGYAGEDQAERTRLELTRDEALRALQDEDKSYQIVKDIADDLKTGYNTAELVFARLQQTHTVKERLHQRAVSFFATNEVVFTGLAASFTAMSGLSEATNTMEAMKEGMSRGLEDLARTGGQTLEAGMRAGYGSTLKVESVKALADAIVDFQESSQRLIVELRKESTEASAAIEAATEDSKRRFTALLHKGG